MGKDFNIVDLFFDSAAKYPGHIAIIDKKRQVTFSQLEEEVENTACYFIKKGIHKDDRVLVFVPMSIDLYRIVLALFKIGAAAVFLDEWVNKKRMEECCGIAQCHAFIGFPKARILSLVSPGLRKIPIHLGTKFIGGIKNHPVKAPVRPDDIALITFTTGSTGTPKAAVRTHALLLEQFQILAEKINPQPGEISLTSLPVVLLINLAAGCTSLITRFKAGKPASMNAGTILNQIIHYKVSSIIASPFFIKILAKHMIQQQVQLRSLKKIFTGGAAVFPEEAKIYGLAFPETAIEIVYGSSEAEPISSVKIEELIRETGRTIGLNVGKPNSNVNVKIIQLHNGIIACGSETAFQKLILPAGSVGEIIVSGPHILDTYFNNEEALKQSKIFVRGTCWHRTGDSGFQMNNTLYLTGRCHTLIYLNNKIISPFLYERYFQTIAGIGTGTILEHEGHLIAVIECLPGFNKKEITEQLQKMDEPFVPVHSIKWIPKMPRDPRHYSKIDYEKLWYLFQHSRDQG